MTISETPPWNSSKGITIACANLCYHNSSFYFYPRHTLNTPKIGINMHQTLQFSVEHVIILSRTLRGKNGEKWKVMLNMVFSYGLEINMWKALASKWICPYPWQKCSILETEFYGKFLSHRAPAYHNTRIHHTHA